MFPRTRHRAARLALLVGWLPILAGCGGGDDDAGQVDKLPASGVHEATLTNNPTAAIDLTHTAVLTLEASGTHDGDSHGDEGIDELRYHFDQPMQLTLSLDDRMGNHPTVVLRDGVGNEVGRVHADRLDHTVMIAAGSHTLELHHPRRGSVEATARMLFVRAVNDGKQASRAAAHRSAARQPGLAEIPSSAVSAGRNALTNGGSGIFFPTRTPLPTPTPTRSTVDITGQLLIERDCPGCDLRGIVLEKVRMPAGDNRVFAEGTPSSSIFNGTFFGCPEPPPLGFSEATVFPPVDLRSADFSGAVFRGVQIEWNNADTGNKCDVNIFNFFLYCSGADLRNANFSGARFEKAPIENYPDMPTQIDSGGGGRFDHAEFDTTVVFTHAGESFVGAYFGPGVLLLPMFDFEPGFEPGEQPCLRKRNFTDAVFSRRSCLSTWPEESVLFFLGRSNRSTSNIFPIPCSSIRPPVCFDGDDLQGATFDQVDLRACSSAGKPDGRAV